MARAFVLLLDSFGIGASQDAPSFGDKGADTFGHIAENYLLHLPNLTRLGLHMAALASTGKRHPGFDFDITPEGLYGYAVERSKGKDTPSGHWEIAGVPVMFEWGYFPPDYPSFPEKLLSELVKRANLPGVLGNKHASGTEIIQELGDEHISTGKPIVYTSADSVFQIAAHEDSFGLQKLYDLCDIARELVDEYNIGRVIARPFNGTQGNFTRTGNRKDISTPPPEPTLFDKLTREQRDVLAIGKTADIYAHQGISQVVKANGNEAIFEASLEAARSAPEGSLSFSNFVDFDMLYGHRRDVEGYGKALDYFDKRLPEFEKLMKSGDIAIITADHGCDPTKPGSDHTREHIPVIVFGPDIKPGFIGRRETFADIGQSIAMHLGITPLERGVSFIKIRSPDEV